MRGNTARYQLSGVASREMSSCDPNVHHAYDSVFTFRKRNRLPTLASQTQMQPFRVHKIGGLDMEGVANGVRNRKGI